ncbi:uncharacterized protein LOC129565960 isoform X2 [Sitodiplosis mosellana]|uniref:uncharacterized protein LOC129565960 isoform X2 n=1 Tax=Sitodiplosis mosellana TaxID=263140 RepID=UPI002444BECC|nr:uncharacterized protein LOC129565960 isoform X2 [Sitodiplosis mosellana]
MEKGASTSDKSESNRAKEQQNPSGPTSIPQSPAKRHVVQQSSSTHEPQYFMLLEEVYQSNKLPLSLERLLHNLCQSNIKAPTEFLIAVVYYLFLESGFGPATLPAELKSKIHVHWGYSFVAQIPDYSWKIAANEISQQYHQLQHNATASTAGQTEQIYEFKLNLLQHSNDDMQLIIRKIFGGAALCVIFCLSRQEHSTSVILPVSEFISANEISNVDHILQSPLNFFRNVRKLNETIKQNLISPSRNVAMYESAYPNAALHGMPKEILWTLFRYLRTDLQTLQQVSKTCVYLRNMAISFLNESNIQLRHRRPTPLIYDRSNQIGHRSRYRIFHEIPGVGLFHGYKPHYFWNRSHFRI